MVSIMCCLHLMMRHVICEVIATTERIAQMILQYVQTDCLNVDHVHSIDVVLAVLWELAVTGRWTSMEEIIFYEMLMMNHVMTVV